MISKKERLFAKISLAFLWIFTGITSVFINPEFGYSILGKVNVFENMSTFIIYSGGILDIIIGLWLLTNKHSRKCYDLQILIIISYTILLTIIDYTYWFHPFGHITKNIPILALIYILRK